jgi:hypothetical protein
MSRVPSTRIGMSGSLRKEKNEHDGSRMQAVAKSTDHFLTGKDIRVSD